MSAADMQDFMDNLAADAFTNMRDEAPRDTGELVNNLRLIRQNFGDTTEVAVVDNTWYSKFVRSGAKPHMIVAGLVHGPPSQRDYRGMIGVPNTWPRKRLWWKGAPKYGYERVYHNTRKPNPYPERAMDATMRNISGLQKALLAKLSAHIRGV